MSHGHEVLHSKYDVMTALGATVLWTFMRSRVSDSFCDLLEWHKYRFRIEEFEEMLAVLVCSYKHLCNSMA